MLSILRSCMPALNDLIATDSRHLSMEFSEKNFPAIREVIMLTF
ncbi:hypothetical protein TSAR_006897 [Trichomalopsis sarcophagae]|uniref:Uncharacterized protein n=1 Tax=Trichomalopsis sarcophagae TaxID=543379 RepID=A0A232EDN3_9HYME|nr:hypothetical protein TSAR_006897 [Trichomalopsis sarcophagae]